MNEKPKNNKEETSSSREGMPFAEMMRKTMDRGGVCCGFNCAEVMSQMVEKAKTGRDPMTMCKEITEKMKKE